MWYFFATGMLIFMELFCSLQTMTMSSKSSKSYKYEVKGKKARDALNQEEQELFDLCQLSGVEISPAVLRWDWE